jgi:hypothetical protein
MKLTRVATLASALGAIAFVFSHADGCEDAYGAPPAAAPPAPLAPGDAGTSIDAAGVPPGNAESEARDGAARADADARPEGGESKESTVSIPTLDTSDLLAGRCATAICPKGFPYPGWLGIEPLVELPVGKSFSLNSGGLSDYINNTGVGINFAAGLRLWVLGDWVSLAVYLSQPVTPQDSHVTIPGSGFEYPASYVRRPYPGFALGFLYDVLWVGIDRDELHNGTVDGSSFRNTAYPPNALVSGVWTWTIAIQPITAFRTGIGTALSRKAEPTPPKGSAGAAGQ